MTVKKNVRNNVVANIKQFLDSDCKEKMKNCYSSIIDTSGNRYFKDSIDLMDDNHFDALFPLVSNVILTANKIECDSLNYIASKQNGNSLKKRKHSLPIFKNSDMGSPEAYIFKVNLLYMLHLNAYETGANTPGGSTDLVRYISDHPLLHPSSIISFGICYGRDVTNQRIGDVIIPRKLYPWSIGQKINDTKFRIKHDNFNLWLEDKFSDSGIYSLLKDFCNGEDGRLISDFLEMKYPNQDVNEKVNFDIRVTFGNMSTGEAVVSSAKVKDMIQESTNNEKELGGEMEGYGLAKECIFYAKIPCFIVKAICDWGELKDIDSELEKDNIECPPHLKDQLQAYASFCAGIVFFQLLDYEKDKLIYLDFINWMDNSKRKKNRVGIFNYAVKDTVINNIKKYFKINDEMANEIFELFLKNKTLVPTRDKSKYHIAEK